MEYCSLTTLRENLVTFAKSSWLGTCTVFCVLLALTSQVSAKEACFPKLMALFDKEIAEELYPGVTMVAMQGDRVILDVRKGNLTPRRQKPMPGDAIFRIYSMTKPITSVAAMMLVEQGQLRLDDQVAKYIPGFANMKVQTAQGIVAADRKITIRDLLRHTSGLTYGFFGVGSVRVAYKAAGIGKSDVNNVQAVKDLAALPLEHQPGTLWEYSRATDVLGHVIELVSGQSLDEFLKARILVPLGMSDTDFNVPVNKQDRAAGDSFKLPDHFSEPAYLSGGGGLVSTAADYMSFLRMLAKGGTHNGVSLLSASTVKEMRTDQLFGNGIKPGYYYFVGLGHGFGHGFGVKLAMDENAWPGPVGTYFWLGYGGTSFWIDPVNDLAVVFLVQTLSENLKRYAQVRGRFYADFGLDGSSAATCLN